MMKQKSPSETISLLNRALRVASVEAYQSEVMESGRYDALIGTNREYPTANCWIKERIERWIEEAEIKPKKL